MTDKSKKQVKDHKYEKHSNEKKHHGHEEISKKDLGKVHGGGGLTDWAQQNKKQ